MQNSDCRMQIVESHCGVVRGDLRARAVFLHQRVFCHPIFATVMADAKRPAVPFRNLQSEF